MSVGVFAVGRQGDRYVARMLGGLTLVEVDLASRMRPAINTNNDVIARASKKPKQPPTSGAYLSLPSPASIFPDCAS